jgi:NAD(P)-dependent dehydrogenase (short-subunit alcohol dehydrogenase family)
MTMTDEPRVAVVTGGAGGLGTAIARRLQDDGMTVAAADLDAGSVSVDGALAVELDVANPASVDAMVRTVAERLGPIDVLINNAGIAGPSAPLAEYPIEDWHQVLAVNLFGVFHCTRACLPAMIARGYGRIVNIASVAGKDGNADMSAYSASKAGVIALTKSVGKETARTGVLVNCVVPGVMEAGLTVKTTEEERQLFLSRVPMGRMGQPEELAELVSWLASPRCSFSTGAAYDLTGGRAVY